MAADQSTIPVRSMAWHAVLVKSADEVMLCGVMEGGPIYMRSMPRNPHELLTCTGLWRFARNMLEPASVAEGYDKWGPPAIRSKFS